MAYRIITTQELIDKFKYALQYKWGYIWGASGQLWTEAKQKAAKNEMAIKYGDRWIGHVVADCSGLFSWAFNKLGSYMYHGSNTMWNKYCVQKGQLKNGKRTDGEELKPGTAVFVYHVDEDKRTHVGLYVGNGQVIEAASTQQGVIASKITNKKWVEWGELKYVNYGTKEPVEEQRLIRYGCKGDDVKWVQQKLTEAGYLCGPVDGIFGKKTLSAVKNFQGSRGLKPDGIVGPLTRAKLEEVK